ncbi:19760_t:CDS:2 [Racocetra fulgida]|uniref:19760_t:CDS:1 n=1 Tax=Racocetra fulgida TaxID=60492 RepID=A0A9N9F0Z9_9GLOM|nr:19760_t:CDS:2 [Racocetra fulgida]
MTDVSPIAKTSKVQEFAVEKLYHEICYRKASRLPSDDGTAGSTWAFTRKGNLFPLIGVEEHHKNEITDLVWNQTGSALASIDQRGKIALWMMENFVNQWDCKYNVDLGGNIVEFAWLDYVRMVYVCYQDGKKNFSKISSELPFISGRISRISHADVILDQGILRLSMTTDVHLTAHINDSSFTIDRAQAPIIHLKLLLDSQENVIRLIIVTADQADINAYIVLQDNGEDDNVFNSDVVMWELQASPTNSEGGISNLSSRDGDHFKEIRFVTSEHLPGQLVTNIWVHKQELFIGFSSGQMQFRHW